MISGVDRNYLEEKLRLQEVALDRPQHQVGGQGQRSVVLRNLDKKRYNGKNNVVTVIYDVTTLVIMH